MSTTPGSTGRRTSNRSIRKELDHREQAELYRKKGEAKKQGPVEAKKEQGSKKNQSGTQRTEANQRKNGAEAQDAKSKASPKKPRKKYEGGGRSHPMALYNPVGAVYKMDLLADCVLIFRAWTALYNPVGAVYHPLKNSAAQALELTPVSCVNS